MSDKERLTTMPVIYRINIVLGKNSHPTSSPLNLELTNFPSLHFNQHDAFSTPATCLRVVFKYKKGTYYGTKAFKIILNKNQ